MRRLIVIIMLTVVALAGETRVAAQGTTFYVQLIRGTDTAQPPVPRSKCVGHKLAETFRPVFKCQAFWEINRQEVTVSPGRVARVQLGNGREAEIDLRTQKARKVAAFQNGQLVDRTISPAGDALTIIGGNRDARSVWFIVVRRDKPTD